MKAKFIFTAILSTVYLFSFAQDRLYIYENGKEKGLVDVDGNLKTKTDFDTIVDLGKDDWTNTKAFLVQKGKKFGLLDYRGKEIFETKYDALSCRKDTCLLRQNSKEGYGTISEKIFIPIEYEKLGFISEKKLPAMQNGKWGYLNLENQFVIQPKFEDTKYRVYDFSEDFAKVCLLNKENACGYINTKGEMIVPQIYDQYSGDFHDGLAATSINNKLAYINRSGKIAFPSDYNLSSDSDFKNGVALVNKNCRMHDDYGVCESYLINTKGENILPKNHLIERSFPEDNYTIIINPKTGNKGVIDNKGKIIVPVQFADTGNYEGPFDWIAVSNRNKDNYEMTGYFDKKGRKITDTKYQICGTYSDESNPNSETFICIERQNGEGRGALDKNGKETIPPDYEDVDLSDNVFRVSKLDEKLTIGGNYNPHCGYLNIDGSVLIPLKYLTCSKFNEGLASVLDKEGWKIINKKNEVLKNLGNGYESVTSFSNGLSHVEKNGKNGLINSKGEIVVPLIYDYIYHYNDVIQVKIGKKYGIIDNKGKVIVPIEYDDTSLSTCYGKVFGEKGKKKDWYNLEGKKLNDKIPAASCYNVED